MLLGRRESDDSNLLEVFLAMYIIVLYPQAEAPLIIAVILPMNKTRE